MEWFFIALIAPALWGINNYIDKYLVSRYFHDKGTGSLAVFASIVAILALPIFYLIEPGLLSLPANSILLAILGGAILLFAVIPYYYAFKKNEASTAVPIFQAIPLFGYLLGFVFLDEILSLRQAIGMLIIISGSVGLSLNMSGEKVKFNGELFFLMLLSSFLYSVSALIFKFVAIDEGFVITTFWGFAGYIIASAFLLILVKSYRKQFMHIFENYKLKVLGLSLVNEIVDTIATMSIRFATLLAPLALVWAVNGFQPFFVLVYGVVLSLFFPHLIKENLTKQHLLKKLILIIIISMGAYLLII